MTTIPANLNLAVTPPMFSATAADGTSYSGPAVTITPPANLPAPVITWFFGPTILAGQSISVNGVASKLFNGTQMNAKYVWNFGDGSPAISDWTTAHVYGTPGTYTLTLTIVDSAGKSGSTTAKITVNPVASLRPIFVSPTGNDSHAGTSAAPIQTIAQLQKMIASNTAVFFARGGTFPTSTGLNLINPANVFLQAYGTGAAPLLSYNGPAIGEPGIIFSQANTSGVVINGLALQTDPSLGGFKADAIIPKGNGFTITNNSIDNIGSCFQLNAAPTGVLIQNNSMTNPKGMSSYFSWLQGRNIVFLGNTCAGSTGQHIIRGASDLVSIQGNNFTSVDGRAVINAMFGSYWNVAGNVLTGPSGVGPPSEPASFGMNAFDSFKWIGNTGTTQFTVNPGASNVYLDPTSTITATAGPLVQIVSSFSGSTSGSRPAPVTTTILSHLILTGITGPMVQIVAEPQPGTPAADVTLGVTTTNKSMVVGNCSGIFVSSATNCKNLKSVGSKYGVVASIDPHCKGCQMFEGTNGTLFPGYISDVEWIAEFPLDSFNN